MAEWETTVTRPDGGGGSERVAVTVDEPARTHPRLHRHDPWWAATAATAAAAEMAAPTRAEEIVDKVRDLVTVAAAQ